MAAATETPDSPWHVVNANDQRRAPLNCILHFFIVATYEEILYEPVDLPGPEARDNYVELDYAYRCLPMPTGTFQKITRLKVNIHVK